MAEMILQELDGKILLCKTGQSGVSLSRVRFETIAGRNLPSA
jgi:hypothetical protein